MARLHADLRLVPVEASSRGGLATAPIAAYYKTAARSSAAGDRQDERRQGGRTQRRPRSLPLSLRLRRRCRHGLRAGRPDPGDARDRERSGADRRPDELRRDRRGPGAGARGRRSLGHPRTNGRSSRTRHSTTCEPSTTTVLLGPGSTSCSARSARSRSGDAICSKSSAAGRADYTCEDIELTFRVHRVLREQQRPYRVVCLPDRVGVTEGPNTVGSSSPRGSAGSV